MFIRDSRGHVWLFCGNTKDAATDKQESCSKLALTKSR